MSSPRVVVIMPVYNEARHLRRVLDSISAQDFDHTRIYFIAVDGGSKDGSREILSLWLRSGNIAGSILLNPRRKIPISLNMALQEASDFDIIVRLDAHTIYETQYLSNAITALSEAPPDVGCVGGAHVPIPGSTFSQKIVEALYTNPMGLGGADYRFGSEVREVDHVYLGVWRAGVLQKAGGFNEQMEANEDGEMSARIRRLGYRILRVPLPCKFIINRGLWGSICQWHRYGYWRCKMLQNNPTSIRKRHIISPAAAVIAVALACSPIRFVLVPLWGLYGVLVVTRRAEEEPALVTLATIVYFPVLQFAFAMGMLAALVRRVPGRWT